MPTEYVIQKRGLAVWQYITWYSDKDQALENFNRLKAGQGYSYRLVELTVLAEAILEGERVDVAPEPEEAVEPVITGWSSTVPGKSWGKSTSFSSTPSDNKDHGMVGKVWLGNPTTKEKKRVDPSMVDAMMAEGWIKAGPRTIL